MRRLTTRNNMGVAVYKQQCQCERCRESFWRLPDLGDGSPTDSLAAYEELEEQGKLLKISCKIGDVVYVVLRGRIIPMEVYQINISNPSSNKLRIEYSCWNNENWNKISFLEEHIGEMVFFQRVRSGKIFKRDEEF